MANENKFVIRDKVLVKESGEVVTISRVCISPRSRVVTYDIEEDSTPYFEEQLEINKGEW